MLPVPNISIRGGGFVMSDLEINVKKTLDLRGLRLGTRVWMFNEVDISYMGQISMIMTMIMTYRRASDEQMPCKGLKGSRVVTRVERGFPMHLSSEQRHLEMQQSGSLGFVLTCTV